MRWLLPGRLTVLCSDRSTLRRFACAAATLCRRAVASLCRSAVVSAPHRHCRRPRLSRSAWLLSLGSAPLWPWDIRWCRVAAGPLRRSAAIAMRLSCLTSSAEVDSASLGPRGCAASLRRRTLRCAEQCLPCYAGALLPPLRLTPGPLSRGVARPPSRQITFTAVFTPRYSARPPLHCVDLLLFRRSPSLGASPSHRIAVTPAEELPLLSVL